MTSALFTWTALLCLILPALAFGGNDDSPLKGKGNYSLRPAKLGLQYKGRLREINLNERIIGNTVIHAALDNQQVVSHAKIVVFSRDGTYGSFQLTGDRTISAEYGDETGHYQARDNSVCYSSNWCSFFVEDDAGKVFLMRYRRSKSEAWSRVGDYHYMWPIGNIVSGDPFQARDRARLAILQGEARSKFLQLFAETAGEILDQQRKEDAERRDRCGARPNCF